MPDFLFQLLGEFEGLQSCLFDLSHVTITKSIEVYEFWLSHVKRLYYEIVFLHL